LPTRDRPIESTNTVNDMVEQVYVGNIGAAVKDGDLAALFGAHGTVRHIRRAVDVETGERRGHALVIMETPEQALAAITALDGASAGGETLSVREARLRPRA